MDTKTSDTSGSVTIWPQEARLEQKADNAQRQKESLLANKTERLDKSLVAGMVRKSNRLLLTISTHKLPFDFFPDSINVEEGRITLITRKFFLSSRIRSIDIKDITNIFINVAPFFAQLVLITKTFTQNETKLNYLRKSEAVYARRIIEGLRSFESKQIDTSHYSEKELIAKLEELSTTDIVT